MQQDQSISNNRLLNYINLILNKFNLKLNFNYDLFPIETKEVDRELIQLVKPFSMSDNIRLVELINSVNYIIKNKIMGDYVECGVWKGANLVLMQKLLERNNIDNVKVYGYDTFEGMSKPSKYDYDLWGNKAEDLMKKTKKKEGRGIWAFSSLETVKLNIENSVNYKENINLIKGMVENTLVLEENLPKKISILRLDTDFYESTKIELEILFPLLEKGGVLIIDDYGHFKGARKAVDEYFENQQIWLKYVDYTCRIYIKD